MPAPDMTAAFDGRLYHATTRARADAALAGGIPAHRSHWGVLPIAQYYLETVEDEGDEGVILSAPLEAFDEAALLQDAPGFEEPITSVVGTSEEDIHAAWEWETCTWRRSLDLIGSLAYDGTLPAEALREE